MYLDVGNGKYVYRGLNRKRITFSHHKKSRVGGFGSAVRQWQGARGVDLLKCKIIAIAQALLSIRTKGNGEEGHANFRSCLEDVCIGLMGLNWISCPPPAARKG